MFLLHNLYLPLCVSLSLVLPLVKDQRVFLLIHKARTTTQRSQIRKISIYSRKLSYSDPLKLRIKSSNGQSFTCSKTKIHSFYCCCLINNVLLSATEILQVSSILLTFFLSGIKDEKIIVKVSK